MIVINSAVTEIKNEVLTYSFCATVALRCTTQQIKLNDLYCHWSWNHVPLTKSLSPEVRHCRRDSFSPAPAGMSHSKPLLIPWLRSQIDSGKYPGVHWLNPEQTEFSIPWKHALRMDSSDTDVLIFKVIPVHGRRGHEGSAV